MIAFIKTIFKDVFIILAVVAMGLAAAGAMHAYHAAACMLEYRTLCAVAYLPVFPEQEHGWEDHEKFH